MSAPRALLVQPPIYDFALYDLFLHPYGLLRIGGWLEQSGYEVALLDSLDAGPPGPTPGRRKLRRVGVEKPGVFRDVPRRYARYGMDPSHVRDRLRAAQPDVVFITTGMTYWCEGLAEIGSLVQAELPGVPIVAGGIAATLMPTHTAEVLGTDHIVSGTVEADRPALADRLARLGLPDLAGDLPRHPSLRIQRQSHRLRDAATLRLHEGCRGRCVYCASRLLAPRFLPGRWQETAAQIGQAVADGITTFAFYDDALLEESDAHLVPLLEWIVEEFGARALHLFVPNAIHLEHLTPTVSDLLHRAGAEEVRLGVESLDEDFHLAYDRKLRAASVPGAVRMLQDAGFGPGRVSAYVLVGLPGQSARSARRTVDRLGELGVAPSIAEYSPVPGTPLFEAACDVSRYPLRSEPVCHNNSVFPTASPEFTIDDLWMIKGAARDQRRRLEGAR